MATKQHITHAEQSYVGAAYFPSVFAANERKGVPVGWLTKVDLGSPIAADTNALIAAATSTELPNAGTKTYTTASGGTSPVDDAGKPSTASIVAADGNTYSVFVLDVPRNITLAVTHDTSIVALSCTITGFDVWGQKVVETLSVTATGTTKSAAGKKAFKWIYSIALTSAGNATTDTANVGFGDVLGLPYKLAEKSDLLGVWFNDTLDSSAAAVAAVTSTASATTGDVRGTVDPNSACDGSAVKVWMHVADNSTQAGLIGVSQYAG